MIYDVRYVIIGIIAYVLLGILTASIAGTLSYLVWLFLEKETARFHIRISMRFLRMVLACYLVPVIPFLAICIYKRNESGYEYISFSIVATIVFCVAIPMGILAIITVFGRKYWEYRKKRYTCMDNVPVNDEERLAILEKWCKKLRIHKKVHLSTNDHVTSPQVLYYKGYQVILPPDITEKNDMNMAILHELVHLKHGDLRTKLIGDVANVLHGFNPLVVKLRNKIERWSEVDCDFAVCEYGKEEFSVQDYYDCLLRLKLQGQEKKATIKSVCELIEDRKLIPFRIGAVYSVTEQEMHMPLYGYLVIFSILFAAIGSSAELFRQINQRWLQGIAVYKQEGDEGASSAADSDGLFEKTDVVHSEIRLLDRADSFDFIINPKEIWVFDVSDENLSAIWIYTFSRHSKYLFGCIDDKGQVLKLDSDDNLADWFDAGEGTIKQVFVKSMANRPIRIELLAGED